jgi:phage terminase Nu1 subunit (DNA packaging protein)
MRIDTIKVGKDQLAQILGVSTLAVDGYVRAGCPVHQKGGPGVAYKFDTAAVHKWLRDREREMATANSNSGKGQEQEGRSRSALAQAELREYELAMKRGELVAVGDVRPLLEDELGAVRARLMSLPGRVAHTVARMTDAAAVELELEREVSDALRELTMDQVDYANG